MPPLSPWPKAQAARLFLRAPTCDWKQIKYGMKREFRMAETHTFAFEKYPMELPIPVVVFKTGWHDHDGKLMVLEETWLEVLGAISPESLAEEGCETLAEFKQRWRTLRDKRGFDPLKQVRVFRVRLWEDGDDRLMADQIFEHLYPKDLVPR